MKVVALAGGIGAGKLLRGLARIVPDDALTVIVNVADDIDVHGLRVSPDPDSVIYWLGDVFDRERGWGRRDETFRAAAELRAFGAERDWFNLGDLDLATHLYRADLLRSGATLSEATARIAARFGVRARVLPVSDDRIETRIDAVDPTTGERIDLHFQEYWVLRGGADQVKGIRYEGAHAARPAPGVIEAIRAADAVVLCPSNPVVSLGPVLAVPGVRGSVAARRDVAVGISGIVAGAPLAGMADRLMPAAGLEVTAAGAAEAYDGLLSAWVIDERDRGLAPRLRARGLRVGVTDSIMTDDGAAERLARAALELVHR